MAMAGVREIRFEKLRVLRCETFDLKYTVNKLAGLKNWIDFNFTVILRFY